MVVLLASWVRTLVASVPWSMVGHPLMLRLHRSAYVIAVMSTLPWPAFTQNMEALKTRALPEIWKEGAKFKEASEKMQAEVAKLEAAAKTGTLDTIKAAFGAAGGSCKNCHDSFQAKAN